MPEPSAPEPPISRFPVPDLADLPDDVRARIDAVQEQAGFIPNVYLALAHRPDEFRAFFAYYDALMLKPGGLSKAEREMNRRRDQRRQRLPLLPHHTRRPTARLRQKSAAR